MKSILAGLAAVSSLHTPAGKPPDAITLAAMIVASSDYCGTPLRDDVLEPLILETAIENGVNVTDAFRLVEMESVRVLAVIGSNGQMARFCIDMRQLTEGR